MNLNFKLLEQATSRLNLRGAGRRMYTEDGTLILDVQNLIDWVIDYYRNVLRSPEEPKSSLVFYAAFLKLYFY